MNSSQIPQIIVECQSLFQCSLMAPVSLARQIASEVDLVHALIILLMLLDLLLRLSSE